MKKQVVCIRGITMNGRPIQPYTRFGSINNFLEIGKVYDVVHESDYFYYINNPYGGQNSYVKEDFIPLEEWRDNKLKEIGL